MAKSMCGQEGEETVISGIDKVSSEKKCEKIKSKYSQGCEETVLSERDVVSSEEKHGYV